MISPLCDGLTGSVTNGVQLNFKLRATQNAVMNEVPSSFELNDTFGDQFA